MKQRRRSLRPVRFPRAHGTRRHVLPRQKLPAAAILRQFQIPVIRDAADEITAVRLQILLVKSARRLRKFRRIAHAVECQPSQRCLRFIHTRLRENLIVLCEIEHVLAEALSRPESLPHNISAENMCRRDLVIALIIFRKQQLRPHAVFAA